VIFHLWTDRPNTLVAKFNATAVNDTLVVHLRDSNHQKPDLRAGGDALTGHFVMRTEDLDGAIIGTPPNSIDHDAASITFLQFAGRHIKLTTYKVEVEWSPNGNVPVERFPTNDIPLAIRVVDHIL
jgi:hypothetical protein